MMKKRTKKRRQLPIPSDQSLRQDYEQACLLAETGRHEDARRLYETLDKAVGDISLKALIGNDLAALAVLHGETANGRLQFQAALNLDQSCEPAQANLKLLDERERIRVAILSFLFNWPSTGGGNVHTYELAVFLGRAGYDVHHFYVRFPPWGVGGVSEALPFPSLALEFEESGWNAAAIQTRFRQCVDEYRPDYAIITDSWNFKPLLAQSVAHYPYYLRFQATECLCPLNNVRLLPQAGGGFRQCHVHQLATPNECNDCLRQRAQWSGALHQAERALSGVGTREYYDRLVRIVAGAQACLVVNPHTEALIGPYARKTCVVTAGMDPARFPWPPPVDGSPRPKDKSLVLFAGLVEEQIKGFQVLHEACARLWKQRQDFELVATSDPPGTLDPFTRLVGWQSQQDLPKLLYACDLLVMPTIAQEALGRTAVEAMAAGKPVVASRLGGLPFTVLDGETGLLCESGNAEDLARKIDLLLDDPDLRQRLGQAGRRRFEDHYAWPVIIEKHYRPLLARQRAQGI